MVTNAFLSTTEMFSFNRSVGLSVDVFVCVPGGGLGNGAPQCRVPLVTL